MDTLNRTRYLDSRISQAESVLAVLRARGDEAPAIALLSELERLAEEREALMPIYTPTEYLAVGPEGSLPDIPVQNQHMPTALDLVEWAMEFAEQDLVLPRKVTFLERSLVIVTTERVSYYAAHYLKAIALARLYQANPKLCWGQWTPEWWCEREREALGALVALRGAVETYHRERSR